uniref:Uncharacterized protein n=1 Tax=Globisporangium ultimum (strain ATCC 200006 / CBS 805.95 / DAOM BR144) TaxID=431595 RepID=K3WIA1_GLOUD
MANESSSEESFRVEPSPSPARQRREDESAHIPETVAPTVPLTKELEALYDFLLHQKAAQGLSDRDYNELMQLNDKQLEAKMRELENWNFGLNLDEAKEIRDSIAMGILSELPSSSQYPH